MDGYYGVDCSYFLKYSVLAWSKWFRGFDTFNEFRIMN